MPALYAHYKFGKNITKILPNNLKKVIYSHKDAFELGLQGPDIFYFYKPYIFIKNKVQLLGLDLHSKNVTETLDIIAEHLKHTKDMELLSYTMGFICHFMLDSEVHPYIREEITYSNKVGISKSHIALETEFDRYLLNCDKFDRSEIINPSKLVAKSIYSIFDNVNWKKVYESAYTMKLCYKVLNSSHGFKRSLSEIIIKSLGIKKLNFVYELMIAKFPDEIYQNDIIILFYLYRSIMPKTAEIITNYCHNIKNNLCITTNERLKRNFK